MVKRGIVRQYFQRTPPETQETTTGQVGGDSAVVSNLSPLFITNIALLMGSKNPGLNTTSSIFVYNVSSLCVVRLGEGL